MGKKTKTRKLPRWLINKLKKTHPHLFGGTGKGESGLARRGRETLKDVPHNYDKKYYEEKRSGSPLYTGYPDFTTGELPQPKKEEPKNEGPIKTYVPRGPRRTKKDPDPDDTDPFQYTPIRVLGAKTPPFGEKKTDGQPDKKPPEETEEEPPEETEEEPDKKPPKGETVKTPPPYLHTTVKEPTASNYLKEVEKSKRPTTAPAKLPSGKNNKPEPEPEPEPPKPEPPEEIKKIIVELEPKLTPRAEDNAIDNLTKIQDIDNFIKVERDYNEKTDSYMLVMLRKDLNVSHFLETINTRVYLRPKNDREKADNYSFHYNIEDYGTYRRRALGYEITFDPTKVKVIYFERNGDMVEDNKITHLYSMWNKHKDVYTPYETYSFQNDINK